MAYACDFSDGASDYLAADVLKVWSAGSSGIGTSDVDGGTLAGPSGLIRGGLNNATHRITGFRIKFASVGGILSFFQYKDNVSDHISLHRASDGSIGTTAQPGGGASVSDPTTVLATGTWYIVEFGTFVSNTVGRIETRVNGTQIPALTSIALGGTVSNSIDTFGQFCSNNITGIAFTGGAAYDIDWVWTKWDSVIWTPSDFLGNVRKITLRPKAGTAGDGFYNTGTGWSVGAGSTTLSDVMREAQMDSDTSFGVRAAAAGTDADRFSVKCDAMPTNTNTVKLVSHRSWVRNTSGSTSTHKRFVYASTGGTTHDSAVTVTDGTSYAGGVAGGTVTSGNHMQDNFLVHPNGAALTKTLVDTMEPGVKVITLT